MKQLLLKAFFVGQMAAIAFTMADVTTMSSGPVLWLLGVVYLYVWYALFALGVTPLVALALGGLRNATAGPSLFSVLILAGPSFLAGWYALQWLDIFNNRELAALLGMVVLAAMLTVGAIVFPFLRKGVASLEERTKVWAVRAPVILFFVATFGWPFVGNYRGFEQLGISTLVIPAIAVGSGAVAAAVKLSERVYRRVFQGVCLAFIPLCLVAWAIGANFPAVPVAVNHSATWSKNMAAFVHSITDFDGDGYSGFLGGGDCAPFDPTRHPGAFEIPGDGIDQNCLGYDAKPMEDFDPPEFVEEVVPDFRPNVLVVTVEALRPDHTSVMGYEKDTTPNLAAYKDDSFLFDYFYASSTYTRLSLPGLFTSRSPAEIDWAAQRGKRMPRVAPSNPWLVEVFQQQGYRTLGITASFPAFTDEDSIGLDRGFELYDSSPRVRYRGGTMRGFPAKTQVNRALELLAEDRGDRPFFLWIHFLEPHYLYERYPGSPDFGSDDKGLYDSEIWGVDHELGRLLDYLEKEGEMDRTILFVTGDHGEEFEEHGERWHGTNLYEPQVRTLGMLRVPWLQARQIPDVVGFQDMAATLSNLAGIREGFSQWSGRNLSGALVGEPLEERPQILETWQVTTHRRYRSAAVFWPYKLIYTEQGGKLELYDLSQDPMERNDLSREKPEVMKVLEGQLFYYMSRTDRQYR